MVQVAQTVLSLLSIFDWLQNAPQAPPATQHTSIVSNGVASTDKSKSIAIIGAGSGGLAILKTLLDFPEDVRSSWDIALYEQRRDVGGL